MGREKIQEKMAGRTPKSEQKGAAFDNEAALIMYLKEVAARRGLTTSDIAEKTGIDQAQVSRFLAGKITPTIASFFKLADAIGVRLRIDSQGVDLFEFIFAPSGWKDEQEYQTIPFGEEE